jgi:hypothetical protein
MYESPTSAIDYAFSIIHIIFPLAYFVFRPLIYPCLGRHWLSQREDASLFRSSSALAVRGNFLEVELAITSKADLNTFVLSTEDDEYTLLHLAVINENYESVQRLLQTGDVQVSQRLLR